MAEDHCSICFNEMCTETHELECGHCFHTSCIVEWFRQGSSQCPLCRDEPEPSELLDGFTLRERAKQLRIISRRKNAPNELKRMVLRIQKIEKDITSYRQEKKKIKSKHKDIFTKHRQLDSKIWSHERKRLSKLRQLGAYNTFLYPLPHLIVH